MYGVLLQRMHGKVGMEKWLKAHVEKTSGPWASNIRRELARMRIVGSDAELSGATLDGKPFDLKSLRGKVVLLDFWATWCGPCVKELPEVKKVYDAYRDQGFEVVGFSLDRSREPLEQFLAKTQYGWTQLYVSDEKARQQVMERYGVVGIPATFLIDEQGKITAMNLRGHERIAKAVAQLLGSTAETSTAVK